MIARGCQSYRVLGLTVQHAAGKHLAFVPRGEGDSSTTQRVDAHDEHDHATSKSRTDLAANQKTCYRLALINEGELQGAHTDYEPDVRQAVE